MSYVLEAVSAPDCRIELSVTQMGTAVHELTRLGALTGDADDPELLSYDDLNDLSGKVLHPHRVRGSLSRASAAKERPTQDLCAFLERAAENGGARVAMRDGRSDQENV